MHPEWFRMDEKGERTPDYNLCPSNRDALDYIAERAAILARTFRPTTGRHHFWLDDNAHSRCHCRDCARLSASDAAMLTYNAIARGVRGADPDARQCYLAYADTLEPPRRVEPADNIFLEYAPFYRDLHRPLTDPENAAQIQPIDELLRVFGARGAEALDYWLDNSYLSDWKEPPQRFVLEPEVIHADMALYEDKGFETVTSFACYLGEDYAKLYRENPDLSFV